MAVGKILTPSPALIHTLVQRRNAYLIVHLIASDIVESAVTGINVMRLNDMSFVMPIAA